MRCKHVGLLVVMFLLVFTQVVFISAATVTRSFGSDPASAGGTVTVNYVVSGLTGSEDYYVLRDEFPDGWIVSNNGGGAVGADSVWTITDTPPFSNPSLILDVPAGATGNYDFAGDYAAVTTGVGTDSGSITGDSQLSTTGGASTVVRLSPTSQAVEAGDTFTVDVYVDNVVNLYGVQFDLDYDETLVTLVDVQGDVDLFGAGFDDSNTLSHNYNQAGMIDDYFIIKGATPGATGSGKIATITFTANALVSGTDSLALSSLILSDPDSGTIVPGNVFGASVEIGYCGDGSSLTGLEQCDDGMHCQDGTTSCTLDSQCTGIGDGLCLVRDGTGCSSVCTLNTCIDSITSNGGGQDCAPLADLYCSPGNLMNSSDSAQCCSVSCSAPQTCDSCGGIFQFLGTCDYAECTGINDLSFPLGCYYEELPGANDCAGCTVSTDCADFGGQQSCEGNSCGLTCVWDGGSGSCLNLSPEVCDDALDNDGDGDIDCVDSDCAGSSGPGGVICCQDISSCGACEECGGSNTCVAGPDGSSGNLCNDECTYCNAGSCDLRSNGDYAECTTQCNSCNGVGTTCQPYTGDTGYQCPASGWECSAGSCCRDADNDNTCDICTDDLSCSDGVSCTLDTCGGTGCVNDVGACNCALADINGDNTVDAVGDISAVVLAFGNAVGDAADIVGNDGVEIKDLIYVVVRFGVCP